MIFGKPLFQAVLDGRKTQTRRPMRKAPRSPVIVNRKTGQIRRRPPRATIEIGGTVYLTSSYRPRDAMHSGEYAAQPGRGKPAAAHIIVTDVSAGRVGDVDYAAARAEGFRTTDEFKAHWVRLHEPSLVSCEGETRDGLHCVHIDDELLVEHFERHHANTRVWVISFQRAREQTKLLTPAGEVGDMDELGDGGDYTRTGSRALPSEYMAPNAQGQMRRVPEPEAVDEATLEYFVRDAAERAAGDPGRRAESLKRRANSTANRLRQTSVTATHAGVDVSAQLDQINDHLAVMERQVQEARNAA